jgi:Uma2 family endonuclease
MPTALILEHIQPQPPLRLKRWTREEIGFLQKNGFLEGQRYELVEGELINKMGMNEPHAFAIRLLTALLVRLFGSRVLIQLPIDVSPEDNPTSEPQPDAAVTTTAASMTSKQPGAGDIVWLIEVSDSTLRFDLTVKAGLYARAGIPDYWVIDLVNRQIIVHRQPALGTYGSVVVYGEQESIAPLESPGSMVRFQEFAAAVQT